MTPKSPTSDITVFTDADTLARILRQHVEREHRLLVALAGVVPDALGADYATVFAEASAILKWTAPETDVIAVAA